MLRQLKNCFANSFPRVSRLWAGDQCKTTECQDANFYRPIFSPWLGYGEFAKVIAAVGKHSLVSSDRLWVLHCLARQFSHRQGSFWECGVYKGGTAALLADILGGTEASEYGHRLRLFDTFAGMPETDPSKDQHRRGDFADTSLEAVRSLVGTRSFVSYHPGFIPESFAGLEDEAIVFAHVDVDIYRSVMDCCDFIYPRLLEGGVMIFDDYGFRSCPGARAAVDTFFENKPEVPLVLPTGQALVFKLA
ncbi:MAG: TylF/MycF/NovP-related O-methyltransferase [Pseudomonadota bacterium]